MPLNPDIMNPLTTRAARTDELHPQKADEDIPTQRKLHTRPHSKHLCRILPPTTQCATMARQGSRATSPQPLPTGATEQTPPSPQPAACTCNHINTPHHCHCSNSPERD
ncbi:hypothetical protein CHARACLAT_010707 [Characodon lateralis]|uniref:Uncharacterized protein n=1 Tax=Characodon lateralis TaxID=208331 RepID=A0ABU7ETP9_9TELE|nr:hypothetical protein [Characodon lateralis]